MKNNIYKFIESLIKIAFTFIVTFVTAMIASDNKNIIYNFLSQRGYSDPIAQKAILSGLIVAAIAILQQIISLTYKTLLWFIGKYFRRLIVEINFKNKNRIRESIIFKPSNGEYKEEQIDIELKIKPAGKISIAILKLLGLRIEVFFNPQIIDVTLLNDQEWLGEKAVTKLDNNQAICIGVLENFRLGGFSMKPYTMTESIIIVPKRVRRDTAYIDFKLTSVIGYRLSRALCNFNAKELNIECEGNK